LKVLIKITLPYKPLSIPMHGRFHLG